jgi:hypothetical protein
VAETTVSAIIRGVRKVSMPMAETLEEATGIQREAWSWPQRHYNPYIPLRKRGACHCACENRRPLI